MTPDAKSALSKTIRALRERLLRDLHDETEAAYRLSIRARDVKLDETTQVRRGRLESWIAEQLRAQDGEGTKAKDKRTAEDYRRDAEKQAAYTLLNRLVILRLMEARGPSGNPLREPAIVTGGWESKGYKHFRQLAPALVRGDETEGYEYLLRLAFEDLATELPGVFGSAGVADLIPVPAATLRHTVEKIDQPELESCWNDDMMLGWVYQYWNDPARERLDEKVNPKTKWGSGKIEPHEIASKTQMFTERYMVDWLLQNSLGSIWLSICRKHNWTPEAEADGTLESLEHRRIAWRTRVEAGEASPSDLVAVHTDSERRWCFYVSRAIPGDAVEYAPSSIREVKLLDPAVGSGHFLVVALDLLLALYREEARHRGELCSDRWSDRSIVEDILSHNLYGLDLDPRAVQIAAAALWLKARQVAADASPERLNLVASNLKLASLPDDDPALVELRREVERETGIPSDLTDTLIHALRGADHLGSLLKVDHAVEQALSRHEAELGQLAAQQGNLFGGFEEDQSRLPIERQEARASLLEQLERFLARRTSGDDLGLRLRGEQLAAGVRFVRMLAHRQFSIVVSNPPYLGTEKLSELTYLRSVYPDSCDDLATTFLERSVDLVGDGGTVALVMPQSWMYLGDSADLRKKTLSRAPITVLADLGPGAFSEIKGHVVNTTLAVLMRASAECFSVALGTRRALGATPPSANELAAALLCQSGRIEFDAAELIRLPGAPLVYWWSSDFIEEYRAAPLVGSIAPAQMGMATTDNGRFLVHPWEVQVRAIVVGSFGRNKVDLRERWQPYLKGGSTKAWFAAVDHFVRWRANGLEVKVLSEWKYGSASRKVQGEGGFFRYGIAFTKVGGKFAVRSHRVASVIDAAGSSFFPEDSDHARFVCTLNSSRVAEVVQALNPTINFQVRDVDRAPLFDIEGAQEIFDRLGDAFAKHEQSREPSAEFRSPGPSAWAWAQRWAQNAVDRPYGAPLPPYEPSCNERMASDEVSYAVGVSLGRFAPDGTGVLDVATANLSHALPAGLLFLDSTLDEGDGRDSLGHEATAAVRDAWELQGSALQQNHSLREWLAVDFFKDVHKGMYEGRPIHWPLSSEKKTFVAWINIHRFDERTLHVLLADHMQPALNRIEGKLADLRTARAGADKKAARDAEKRYDRVFKARDELTAFIADVEQCADRGPLPTDTKCPAREQDARYAPNLDDGVMINSAALWKLLEPQWKEPKRWWKELAAAKDKKDYDWSHLAMRYWPTRVDKKCKDDPSLAVAHGCFWRYHPERAWAWELRLQDEIGPEFRIVEASYRPGGRDLDDQGDAPHREAWIRNNAAEALAAVEKEAIRRMGRGKDRRVVPEVRILEQGLWSALPDEIWAMELRLAEKQGAELRLRSPDEADARAAFEADHPELVRAREHLLKELPPVRELFEEKEPDRDRDSDVIDEDEEEIDLAAEDA